jgi:hypothetical protein
MGSLEEIKIKGVPVKLKGEDYHIKFDLNSFAELEDKYGSIEKAMIKFRGEIVKDANGVAIVARDAKDEVIIDKKTGKPQLKRSFSIKLLRTILWAGLIHQNPNLTEMEVGAMLDFDDLIPVMEKVADAIDIAMPKLTKEEKAAADRAIKLEEAREEEAIKVEKVETPGVIKSDQPANFTTEAEK